MSKNKSVYTCETCSALYLCLKYFQEHRRKHADQEGRKIITCTHCPQVFTSDHESHLHSITHKNELPHHCDVCQKVLGISEEEVQGSRRSIGTTTDFHVLNISLDGVNTTIERDTKTIKREDEDGEEDDDEDDYDDDDEDDDEEEEDDDEDDEEDEEEEAAAGVTAMINSVKKARPSRSTGKGKGNRKARITGDGDTRRKFSCCHCGKSFKTKSHLQRHILTHTGEKPYHCNRCDQRFNQSSTLRNHVIALHTKEYPHTCTNCSKGFLMPAVLQKHLSNSECGKVVER